MLCLGLCRPADLSGECPFCQPTDANIEQTRSSLAEECDLRCPSCGNCIAAARVIQRRHRRELYLDGMVNNNNNEILISGCKRHLLYASEANNAKGVN